LSPLGFGASVSPRSKPASRSGGTALEKFLIMIIVCCEAIHYINARDIEPFIINITLAQSWYDIKDFSGFQIVQYKSRIHIAY